MTAAAASVSLASADAPAGTRHLGGWCKNDKNQRHDFAFTLPKEGRTVTPEECDKICRANNDLGGLRGFSVWKIDQSCGCFYDNGKAPGQGAGLTGTTCPSDSCLDVCDRSWPGSGKLIGGLPTNTQDCYEYLQFPVSSIKDCPVPNNGASSNGDPHFKTFHNEHFEFHGQCDLVMASVKNFANQKDVSLDIHLRTKLVRFWSYNEVVAIRIGNDILEVKGSNAKNGELNYWINFQSNGKLSNLAGFPVTISPIKNKFTIDLDSVYAGQKIEIKTFREFVSVNIVRPTEESFGTSVGIIGDFKTGKTLARDGETVLDDFTDLGLEWQVLPTDDHLFHDLGTPKFPVSCLLPEDPRGVRGRRLAESSISIEDAEITCASLKDPLTIKDCVYDILATQDIEMVGAF